jgi:hypothetical protein
MMLLQRGKTQKKVVGQAWQFATMHGARHEDRLHDRVCVGMVSLSMPCSL